MSMGTLPIRWAFKRKSIMPIVDVIGECDILEGEDVIVLRALDFIEKAGEFKGVPYQISPIKSNYPLSISFGLLFPSEEKIVSFLEWVQKLQ